MVSTLSTPWFTRPMLVDRERSELSLFNGEAEILRLIRLQTTSASPHPSVGAMMANWDLPGLRARMCEIDNAVLLIHSDNDAAIPLDWAREALGWIDGAQLEVLDGYGHLAHEEAPEAVAALIRDFAEATLKV